MYSSSKAFFQPRTSLFGGQCPYCHEPTMANHLYCRVCGASQIVPDVDRGFCPFCGLRVGQGQEFCHECCGYLLPEETPNLEQEPPSILQRCSSMIPALVNRYHRASLIVGGLIIILIAYLAFTKATISSPNFAPNEPEPISQSVIVAKEAGPGLSLPRIPVPSPSPVVAQPTQPQLMQILNQIRAAQLNKDINLFMSSFSPNFPDIDDKRQKVLKIWQVYDYLDMKYEIKDMQKLDNNTTSANISWQFEVRDKNSGIKQIIKTYKVSFSKEGGRWLIRNEL
jgi:hypothetical protein